MKRMMNVLVTIMVITTLVMPLIASAEMESKAVSIVTDDTYELVSNYLGYRPIYINQDKDCLRVMVRGGVLIPVRYAIQEDKYIVSSDILREIRHKYAYPITGEQAYVSYKMMATFLTDYAEGTIIRQYLDDVIEIYGGEGLHLRLSFDDDGIIKGDDDSLLYNAEKIAQFVFDWECGE